MHLHLANGFDEDALERAAPSGVNSGYGAILGVYEEDRDAVGGLDGEEEAGAVGGGGIASARFGGGGVEEMDHIRMDLLQRNEFEVRCAECRLEAAAVFEDVFFAVPFRKT
jgi:hypothetical protein